MGDITWFENLCQQLLSSSGQSLAVQQLDLFKETDSSLAACQNYLRDARASDLAKFHSLTVLQYGCLHKWDALSDYDRSNVKQTLYGLLSQILDDSAVLKAKFAVNKLLQVFASIWKRDWLICIDRDKEWFFQFIHSLMDPGASSEKANLVGCMLLRTVIDEFSIKSVMEANLSFDFHSKVKRQFEETYLTKFFLISNKVLSSIMLNISTEITKILGSRNDDYIKDQLLLLEENLKLQIEIISWDFTDSLFGKISVENSSALPTLQTYCLPVEWTVQIFQPEFLSSLVLCFRYLQTSMHILALVKSSSCCRLEIMNLLSIIPSIDFNAKSPPLSPSNHALTQNDHSSLFGINVIDMANSVILMSEACSKTAPVSLYSKDFEEGGAKSDDLQLYCNIIQRLHCNLKLESLLNIPKYEEVLHHIGVITRMMSDELSQLADTLYVSARNTVMQSISPSAVSSFFQKHDLRVLDTWRRDVLFICIDIWIIVLDHSVVCDLVGGVSARSNKAADSFVSSRVFADWLQSTMKTTFEHLFHCAMCTYLLDSMASDEQEEGQEEEAIDSRDVDELLSSFCCIGRACFPSAASVVSTYLNNSMRQAVEIATQQPLELQQQRSSSELSWMTEKWHKSCLEVLERVRIGLITLSHLCFDNFQEMPSLDGGSGETTGVNGLILAHLRCDPSCSLLDELLMTALGVLSFQMTALLNASSQWMLSPLLLKLVYRFFAEFILRFVEPDESVYSSENWEVIHRFAELKGSFVDAIILQLLQSGSVLLNRMPLELDLVLNISDMLKSLSRSKRVDRMASIVSTDSVRSIVDTLARPYDDAACRLNCEGLTACCSSVCSLLVRSNAKDLFILICTAVYAPAEAKDTMRQLFVLERNLSCLRGLFRIPVGFDDIIQSLLKSCFPVLRERMTQFSDNEGLLTTYLFMLRECAEYFISRLDNVTCFELYKSSYGLLQLFSPPLRAGDASTTRSESIFDLLCLLNHLSTKEFAFSEDYTLEVSHSFEAEIAAVLLCGLEMIVPVVTVETLEGYPATEEKYFSFIAFLTGAFFNQMVRWVYDSEKGKASWLQVIQHLLWGVTSIHVSAARVALQALQSIAANQFQWVSLQMVVNNPHTQQQPQHRQQVIHAQKQLSKMQGLDAQLQAELLLPVIDRLSQILLSRSPSQTGNKPAAEVCWDRVDSFANAFITFIALDPGRFQQVAEFLVSCQPVSLQPTLGDCLLQLTTARNVLLVDVSKPNRIKFVQNFREFCVRIKSLAIR